MTSYDADLQAAVDSTSAAKDGGETDLRAYLVQMLADREITTTDDAWLDRMLAGIDADPNYLIESEPSDYSAAT